MYIVLLTEISVVTEVRGLAPKGGGLKKIY
jgi:hypothetical protein